MKEFDHHESPREIKHVPLRVGLTLLTVSAASLGWGIKNSIEYEGNYHKSPEASMGRKLLDAEDRLENLSENPSLAKKNIDEALVVLGDYDDLDDRLRGISSSFSNRNFSEPVNFLEEKEIEEIKTEMKLQGENMAKSKLRMKEALPLGFGSLGVLITIPWVLAELSDLQLEQKRKKEVEKEEKIRKLVDFD